MNNKTLLFLAIAYALISSCIFAFDVAAFQKWHAVSARVADLEKEYENLAYPQNPQNYPPNVGIAAFPNTPAFTSDSLAAKVQKTDATMTLVSGKDANGNNLSGTYGFVIDEGTASQEVVTCTASGTALSSCTRGVDLQNATSSVASLEFVHSRGAIVKVTTYPTLGILSNIFQGKETIPVGLLYNVGFHPCTGTSASTTVCDQNYIDKGLAAGASPGSPTVAGIFLGASALQQASGTATGVYNSITYNLVPLASNGTDTPQTACSVGYSAKGAGCNVIADLLGNVWKTVVANLGVANIFTANQTFNGGMDVFTGTNEKVGIGTSSPYAPLSVVGSGGIVGWLFNATSTTATSTFAGNLQISNNATTTNLTVSNTVTLPNPCTSCTISGAVSVSSTFSGPTSAQTSSSGTATCVSPKIVSGGGFSGVVGNNSANAVVQASQPNGTTGWSVTTFCGFAGGCTAETITVYAMCVNP